MSEMGSSLLARLLGLTDVQAGVLSIVFRVADDKGWLLIDLKDLRSMVAIASRLISAVSTSLPGKPNHEKNLCISAVLPFFIWLYRVPKEHGSPHDASHRALRRVRMR